MNDLTETSLNALHHYSHSGLKYFESCPLKFKFKYITKPSIELKESIEAFVGKRFHETMEFLYKNVHYTNVPSLEVLFDFFEQQWKKEWNNSIIILNNSLSKEDYFNYGKKCIANYYNKFKPFNDSITLALEKEVLFPLDSEGKITIKAVIDRLSKKDDVYQIHDYKTAGSLPDKKMLEEDRQLSLYALAIQNQYNDVNDVELLWHYVGFNETFVVKRNIQELERIRQETINLIEKIQREKSFPAKPSALCAYCEYKEICPEWSHILKVQQLPANKYLNEEGIKLANKYIELRTKKAEFNEKLDLELEELEDAIFLYAEKNNYTVIAGSDFNLKLWKGKNISLPPKGSPEFKEIEEELKKANLFNEFLSIDRFELSKKLSANALPSQLKEKIMKYSTENEVRRIYLKKIEEAFTD